MTVGKLYNGKWIKTVVIARIPGRHAAHLQHYDLKCPNVINTNTGNIDMTVNTVCNKKY
jgi:hypothetical protein